jgi:hypothetical protein
LHVGWIIWAEGEKCLEDQNLDKRIQWMRAAGGDEDEYRCMMSKARQKSCEASMNETRVRPVLLFVIWLRVSSENKITKILQQYWL